MHAETQYRLSAADLEVVLAMARTGTLAAAGDRLGVDASTVFRSLQRIERGLGQSLFARSRTGYLANELAQSLAERAEQVEAARMDNAKGWKLLWHIIIPQLRPATFIALVVTVIGDRDARAADVAARRLHEHSKPHLSLDDQDGAFVRTKSSIQHLPGVDAAGGGRGNAWARQSLGRRCRLSTTDELCRPPTAIG